MMLQWTALLVLLQLGTVPPVVSTARGAIEGTVVRGGNREPVGDVRVVLINTALVDIDPTRPPASPSATTDAQGHFSLKNLEPGGYRLTFSA